MKLLTFLIVTTISFSVQEIYSHDVSHSDLLDNLRLEEMKKLIIHKKRKETPQLKVKTIKDQDFTINKKNGKVYVLNFWATWCAPCREEMPALQILQEQLGSNSFSVITIATGRNSQSAMLRFFQENSITSLPLFRDPRGELASSMGIFGLPTTLIVDQHGLEVARLIGGANWASKPAIDIFQKILGEHKN